MRRFFFQALVLLGVSAAVAVGAAWLHPRAPAWYLVEPSGEWDFPVEHVSQLQREGAILWIDARKEAEFAAGHLPGAILLNEERWGDLVFEHQDRLQEAMGRPVVVYCDGSGCERSQHVAERLRQLLGLDRVYVLRGDWRKIEP
jgi:rhodanese-related sulfurtransferase